MNSCPPPKIKMKDALAFALQLVMDGATHRTAIDLAGDVSKGALWAVAKGISKHHKIGPCVEFNGKRYHKANNGYWRASTKLPDGRQRKTYLHRDVWEFHMGPIARGWHVHHKDHNKDNNELTNLELLDSTEHWRRHFQEGRTPRAQAA
jgi:hypothetical protein